MSKTSKNIRLNINDISDSLNLTPTLPQSRCSQEDFVIMNPTENISHHLNFSKHQRQFHKRSKSTVLHLKKPSHHVNNLQNSVEFANHSPLTPYVRNMHRRASTKVHIRLFKDSAKYKNLREQKTRKFKEEELSGLFIPKVNKSQKALSQGMIGRKRASSCAIYTAKQKTGKLIIRSKFGSQASNYRNNSQPSCRMDNEKS